MIIQFGCGRRRCPSPKWGWERESQLVSERHHTTLRLFWCGRCHGPECGWESQSVKVSKSRAAKDTTPHHTKPTAAVSGGVGVLCSSFVLLAPLDLAQSRGGLGVLCSSFFRPRWVWAASHNLGRAGHARRAEPVQADGGRLNRKDGVCARAAGVGEQRRFVEWEIFLF